LSVGIIRDISRGHGVLQKSRASLLNMPCNR
jgi:hypothetical protein